MHTINKLILFTTVAALSTTVMAQEEETPKPFTYATYFYCDVTGQERADEIVKTYNAPVNDQMVKEGVMTGWGWLAHHTGGKWRRVQYHQAMSLDALLDAQDEMGKRMDAAGDTSDDEFGKICNAHEDYIWQVESGTAGADRGAAGFSVYYKCNESKEDRADEIWANDFAPILNKYVEAGKISSWGWSSHWVGGAYRKLQTMTGADHKSLLKARGELIGEMYAEESAFGEEFTEICGSHSDYMWDIQLETH